MAPFVYSYVLDPPERRPLASLVVYAASAAAVEGVQAMLPNPAVDTLLRRRLRSPHDFPYLFDYVMGVVAHGSLTEQVCRTVSSCDIALPPPAPPLTRDKLQVHRVLVSLIKVLPLRLSDNPDAARATVLSALLMLRMSLALHPVPDPHFLLAALPAVRALETWPQPYGGFAAHVRCVCVGLLSPTH